MITLTFIMHVTICLFLIYEVHKQDLWGFLKKHSHIYKLNFSSTNRLCYTLFLNLLVHGLLRVCTEFFK